MQRITEPESSSPTGRAFDLIRSELGSGFVQSFLAAPTGNGWALCNGTSILRMNADGTTSAVTVPDYTTAAYLKLGITATPGPTAASGVTASVSAGILPLKFINTKEDSFDICPIV